MPNVLSTSVNVEYQIGLVCSGDIPHIAGYLPDGDRMIPAVITDLKPSDKVGKHGLNLTGVAMVPNGTVPKKYDTRFKIHLCKQSCTQPKSGGLHLGEWAYLTEGESGEGGPLLACLAIAKAAAEAPAPPPGLRPPLGFVISTPAKASLAKTEQAGPLVEWAEAHGVPEVVDLLTAAGFREVKELGMLDRAGVDALFASSDDGHLLGTKCRFLLALAPLQRQVSAEWPTAAESRVPTGSVSMPSPDFGTAGPLEEFAATARTLLSQVGGPEASSPSLAPARMRQASEAGLLQNPGGVKAAAMKPGDLGETGMRSACGGRLVSAAGSRPDAKPVGLKVLTLQAGAIAEEWSSAGTVRFESAVAQRTWKKAETKASAFALARSLDVATDSGLILTEEPWAEVTLRELAALWFADRHPGETETADFLRESSMASFGVPRGLWLEAREFRKLTRGVAKTSD